MNSERRTELRTAVVPKEIYAIVQCEGYRCLAIRKRDGKWYDYHRHDVIEGPVKLLDEYREMP
jgi:hypothetical protein